MHNYLLLLLNNYIRLDTNTRKHDNHHARQHGLDSNIQTNRCLFYLLKSFYITGFLLLYTRDRREEDRSHLPIGAF